MGVRDIQVSAVLPETRMRPVLLVTVVVLLTVTGVQALTVGPTMRAYEPYEYVLWSVSIPLIVGILLLTVHLRFRRLVTGMTSVGGAASEGWFFASGAFSRGNDGSPPSMSDRVGQGWIVLRPESLEIWRMSEGRDDLLATYGRGGIERAERLRLLAGVLTEPVLRVTFLDGRVLEAQLVHGDVRDIFGFRAGAVARIGARLERL